MTRVANQRQKILWMLKILMDHTDEAHGLNAEQMIAKLESHGISAERKSIYRDIEELKEFGFDILQNKAVGGYYLATREFELPELKLLVDAVQSSKFITYKKTEELIKKIESLASVHQAKGLRRQVVVRDRIKNMNESIYYNVDYIQNALTSNRKIRFQYYEWTPDKEKKLRKNGDWYEVSPWVLTWVDENYYLIAFDGESQKVKHYRVDKMQRMEVSKFEREGEAHFRDFNVGQFAKKTFGMFGGETETVVLRCENHFAGIMIDRFGQEVPMRRDGEAHFLVRPQINVSEQFFGWLTGLGCGVKIQGPESVKEKYRKHLLKILE